MGVLSVNTVPLDVSFLIFYETCDVADSRRRVDLNKINPKYFIITDSVYALVSIYLCILFMGILLIALGVLLIPKKNRRKTYTRASSIRNSLRNSFKKKNNDQNLAENNGVILNINNNYNTNESKETSA